MKVGRDTKVKILIDANSNKPAKPPKVLFKRSTTTIGSEFTKLYTEKTTSHLTRTESEKNLIHLEKIPHLEPITNESNSSITLFPKRGISEIQFQVKPVKKESMYRLNRKQSSLLDIHNTCSIKDIKEKKLINLDRIQSKYHY